MNLFKGYAIPEAIRVNLRQIYEGDTVFRGCAMLYEYTLKRAINAHRQQTEVCTQTAHAVFLYLLAGNALDNSLVYGEVLRLTRMPACGIMSP